MNRNRLGRLLAVFVLTFTVAFVAFHFGCSSTGTMAAKGPMPQRDAAAEVGASVDGNTRVFRSGAAGQTVDPLTGAIVRADGAPAAQGIGPIGAIQDSSEVTQAGTLVEKDKAVTASPSVADSDRHAMVSAIPSSAPPRGGTSQQRQQMAGAKAVGKREELWVIEKGVGDAAIPADDATPGTGAMTAKPAGQDKAVAIPLKHTDVKASVAGYIASVEVTQQFQNPYAEKIEATYVFPLPHNAAVNEFVMTIGDRRIRGIIRERAEAEKIYNEAKSQGYVASLLTQERPNIFTQAVANIEPGKAIDVNIKYFNTLSYVDGAYEFVFPMVVGPRFNPPGQSDGVGAVGRGSGGASGQSTEVQYLKPDERSGHDISLSVHVDAGVAMESLDSRNHRVTIDRKAPAVADVTLAADDRLPNKDFVLRFGVAGKELKSTAVACRDEKGGGYFTLMLVPPEATTDLPRQPLEMVFTIDVSGSQTGQPLEQEKAAVKYALQHLNPADTFQVMTFASGSKKLFRQPVPADSDAVSQAIKWVDGLQTGGGTMMVEGMRASLAGSTEGRLRFVSFFTDGFIGNEADVLKEMHNGLGGARVFSFGVGSSPNRYLLEHMAKVGNGVVAYVGLNDDAGHVMSDYFARISRPALANPVIEAATARVSEVYPERIPDVFAGRPTVITGRFTGDAPQSIRVRGNVGGQDAYVDVPVRVEDKPAVAKALPAVWARAKIADLGDRQAWEPTADTAGQTRQIALEYGLMSPYTAMVAVDSLTRTGGDHGTSVAVPVPVPDGVRYETTVMQR